MKDFVADIEEQFRTEFVLEQDVRFHTDFTQNTDYEFYHGNYAVTPKRVEQILATANKVMAEDVIIKEIPYSATSNLSGGQTFYIAKGYDE